MDRNCVSLAIFISLFAIQVYGNELVHRVYLCGDERSNDHNTCTKENYYGFFLNVLNLINKCADEKSEIKVQNLLHCVQIGQDPSNAFCRKNEQECRACQCLSLCVFEGMGIVDQNGKVDEQVLKEVIHILQYKMKDFSEFDTNWEVCKEHSVKGTDACKRAYETLMCLIGQDYKKGMDIINTSMLELVIAQQQCGKNIKCTKYPTFFLSDKKSI